LRRRLFQLAILSPSPGHASEVLQVADAQPGRGRIKQATTTFYRTERNVGMNFILWLVIGGILGWIASIIMQTNAQQGIFLNIVVGIIGAMVAGFLLTPLLGIGTINQNNLNLSALFVSLLGSIILLAIVNLFRRGAVR
jgi:uncharacterized membrane protein YeaQ/YmgE (transglycosylase-associated protein family)